MFIELLMPLDMPTYSKSRPASRYGRKKSSYFCALISVVLTSPPSERN